MPDLKLQRDFAVAPERLFEVISTQSGLLTWWGPEGMHVPEHALDFTAEGPWFSVMENSEGQQYRVSGQVTHVSSPRSVGFTWAWHDEQDNRGPESHVTFTVSACDTGARLTIGHHDLSDSDAAKGHEHGWRSSLNKLESLILQ